MSGECATRGYNQVPISRKINSGERITECNTGGYNEVPISRKTIYYSLYIHVSIAGGSTPILQVVRRYFSPDILQTLR